MSSGTVSQPFNARASEIAALHVQLGKQPGGAALQKSFDKIVNSFRQHNQSLFVENAQLRKVLLTNGLTSALSAPTYKSPPQVAGAKRKRIFSLLAQHESSSSVDEPTGRARPQKNTRLGPQPRTETNPTNEKQPETTSLRRSSRLARKYPKRATLAAPSNDKNASPQPWILPPPKQPVQSSSALPAPARSSYINIDENGMCMSKTMVSVVDMLKDEDTSAVTYSNGWIKYAYDASEEENQPGYNTTSRVLESIEGQYDPEALLATVEQEERTINSRRILLSDYMSSSPRYSPNSNEETAEEDEAVEILLEERRAQESQEPQTQTQHTGASTTTVASTIPVVDVNIMSEKVIDRYEFEDFEDQTPSNCRIKGLDSQWVKWGQIQPSTACQTLAHVPNPVDDVFAVNALHDSYVSTLLNAVARKNMAADEKMKSAVNIQTPTDTSKDKLNQALTFTTALKPFAAASAGQKRRCESDASEKMGDRPAPKRRQMLMNDLIYNIRRKAELKSEARQAAAGNLEKQVKFLRYYGHAWDEISDTESESASGSDAGSETEEKRVVRTLDSSSTWHPFSSRGIVAVTEPFEDEICYDALISEDLEQLESFVDRPTVQARLENLIKTGRKSSAMRKLKIEFPGGPVVQFEYLAACDHEDGW